MAGLSMDDVRVHRDSPRPAQLQAHAFAQASDIHLGPGQERHLPHEAWHVVQQKQGRVRATTQWKGTSINDDPQLEAEADRMGAQAMAHPRDAARPATVPAHAPPAPGAVPIQGYFTFVSRLFDYEASKTTLAEKIAQTKADKSFLAVQENREAVMAQIRDWAKSDVDEGYFGRTYDELIKNAVGAVIKKKAVQPAPSIAVGSGTKVSEKSVQQELGLSPEAKIEKLSLLRRQASMDSLELRDFRDVSTTQHLTHKDESGTKYGIASGGSNFMLGGNLPDDYDKLLKEMKRTTGLDDQALAATLVSALRGEDVSGSGKASITKFVALVYGPEFRRAAINPIAVQAVLMGVAQKGGDLFAALSSSVLFMKRDGGSQRSQYHRTKVDRTDAEFAQVAVNEHDALIRAAASLGYDVANPKAMEAFITDMAARHVEAHRVIFEGAKRVARAAPKKTDDGGILTNAWIPIALIVIAAMIFAIDQLIRRTAQAPE